MCVHVHVHVHVCLGDGEDICHWTSEHWTLNTLANKSKTSCLTGWFWAS